MYWILIVKIIFYFLLSLFASLANARCALSYSNANMGNYDITRASYGAAVGVTFTVGNCLSSSDISYLYVITSGAPENAADGILYFPLTNGTTTTNTFDAYISTKYNSLPNIYFNGGSCSNSNCVLGNGTFTSSVYAQPHLYYLTKGTYTYNKTLYLQTTDSQGTYTLSYPWQVSLNVPVTCSVNATGINFGVYDKINGNSVSSVLSSSCTNGVAYSLSLNGGNNSIAQRVMTNGVSGLLYNIYIDSGFTTIFGDGISAAILNYNGTGNTQNTTVYGRIDANRSPDPGSYTDNLILTLTY